MRSLTITYFHTGNPHYHRRGVVSRSCSGWEGVGPTRYGHQAKRVVAWLCNATNLGRMLYIEWLALEARYASALKRDGYIETDLL
ncbi:Uncharacterised protein [Burkholderia pseudomallei]|nr:Uncharacterised protein [Burkholderia pseudomallei]